MRAGHLLVFVAAAAACNSNTATAKLDGAAAIAGSGGASAAGGRATGGTVGTGGTIQSGGAGGGTIGSGGATGTGGGGGYAGRDAGADMVAKLDGVVAGGGAGGGSGGGSGDVATDGARAEAGPELGPEARPDSPFDGVPDARPDGGTDTPNVGGSDATTHDGAPCPYTGNVTYTLTKSASAGTDEQSAYPLITKAMDQAVYYYNCYTNITKKLTVTYNASVQTVDGNLNGSIRFGPDTGYMEYTRAMHEIGHTVGVGTASNWLTFLPMPDGGGTRVWIGANATAELRGITGVSTDVIKGDTQHFWPYGLNYASEVKSEADVIDHCRIVMALRKDMGVQ